MHLHLFVISTLPGDLYTCTATCLDDTVRRHSSQCELNITLFEGLRAVNCVSAVPQLCAETLGTVHPVTGHEGPEGGQRHAPGRFTPWKDPVPTVQEAGWAPWPVWTGADNLASTGIRYPDRPARSQSLYRLSCPQPMNM